MVLWGIHCAVDLKWGEAETMGMKKTWQGCEKQPTSITSEGTVPKMVHEKVGVEKHSHMSNTLSTSVLLEAWISARYQSQRKTGPSRASWLGIISSSCALRDTYKPVKAECAVFERVGEVKSRVSLMPNCSH